MAFQKFRRTLPMPIRKRPYLSRQASGPAWATESESEPVLAWERESARARELARAQESAWA
jgi:hypothetical protein